MNSETLIEAAEILKQLQHSSSIWVPAASVVIGAFVGAVAVIIPNFLLEKHRDKKERIALGQAMAVEVSSTLEVIEARGHIKSVAEILEKCLADESYRCTFCVHTSDTYNSIFKASLPKIGLLDPEDAKRFIEFHHLFEAIALDVKPGGLVAQNQCGKEEFSELKRLMDRAVVVGHEIRQKYA